MAISWIANGTAFNRITSGTNWTWNKPGGSLATGDLMIASVIWDPNNSQDTYTLPTGWTLIKMVYVSNGSVALQLVVAYRVVEAGDGSSWAGTIGASTATCAAAVTSYRGVQSIGNNNSGTSGTGSSCSTGSATSPSVTGPWRVTVGAYTSGSASYTISSNEIARRITYTADDSGDTGAIQGSIWDSDAAVTVSTSYSRSVSRSANWSAALATIFYLTPQTGTPAAGSWSSSLGNLTAEAVGEVHDDGVVDADLPSLTYEGTGLGVPPVVTGDLDASLSPLSATAEGGTDVLGAIGALLPVTAQVVGETRVFGVRVINVEAEDRTVQVESRGVAD